jgi:dienelactone hydrolase
MRVALFLILFSYCLGALSQEKVSFTAEDGLKVTADLYLDDYLKPFILLFHQAESSRGEYADIAPKLQKLGYNCLSVDLRSGEKSNYVKNETAERAQRQNVKSNFIDAQQDIEGAIDYVLKFNNKPVILFGSSYSASLALLTAASNNRVSSVIAFSPGEYFRPEIIVKEEISELKLPLFIAASEIEYRYVKELTAGIISEHKMLFKPNHTKGAHGAKALWDITEGSSEYWLMLSQFFRTISH